MHVIVAAALQQRIVVVGGTLVAPLLRLTVLPAAIGLFSRRRANAPLPAGVSPETP